MVPATDPYGQFIELSSRRHSPASSIGCASWWAAGTGTTPCALPEWGISLRRGAQRLACVSREPAQVDEGDERKQREQQESRLECALRRRPHIAL